MLCVSFINEPEKGTIIKETYARHSNHISSSEVHKDQCTEQELRTFTQWLKSPDNHIDLDLVVQPLWDAIDKDMSHPNEERENELRREVSSLLSEIKQKNKFTSNSRVRSKNRLNGFYRVAAILILAFSVTLGLLKVLDRPQPVVTYAEKCLRKVKRKFTSGRWY